MQQPADALHITKNAIRFVCDRLMQGPKKIPRLLIEVFSKNATIATGFSTVKIFSPSWKKPLGKSDTPISFLVLSNY